MGLYLLHIVLLCVLGWAGAFIGMAQGDRIAGIIGAGLGVAVGGMLWWLEHYLRTISLRSYLHGLSGLVIGLLLAALGSHLLTKIPLDNPVISQVLSLLCYVVGAYLGIFLGLWKGPELYRQEEGDLWFGGRPARSPIGPSWRFPSETGRHPCGRRRDQETGQSCRRQAMCS